MLLMRYLTNIQLKHRITQSKWVCIHCIRYNSSTEPKTKTYSSTILIPKTNFPARSSNAKKEAIQRTAQFAELYSWQREHLKGKEFVLHDGPPYANGDLHMGHAVNKIIKDITNRSQILQGNRVHYVPGWDCHGLPIEFKALQRAKKSTNKNVSDPIQTRHIARSFALETVEKQKKAFASWGVMADWEKQYYLTLDKKYIQSQLKQFYKMYKSGLIYRALKPVYWSPSSKTALAEAELEYDPQYKSTEVYVAYPMENVPQIIRDTIVDQPLSAIVWTTTPWTLVANRAICYNPQMKYSVIKLGTKPGLFLVASDQIDEVQKILAVEVKRLVEFDGASLEGSTYRSRLSDDVLPLVAGEHVSRGKGTGLVHTAPAHGPEDFLVALKQKITVKCNVDEHGRYSGVHPDLDGLPVLSAGQEAVLGKLGDSVLYRGGYVHSYPLDWRTKQPVIIRASEQWFIDTDALKDRALAALDSVEILPPSSAEQARLGFRAQLERRRYWCISRQRSWGVPIPAVYSGDRHVVDEGIVERLCSLMDAHGADAWWRCGARDLVPDDTARRHHLNVREVTKGTDIMDIWLDSGLSWQTLGGGRARLYCEGVDQLTGWFQAALLTALALRDEAPFECIFVHGFVVDEKKRKMSKSLGNVLDPASVIDGDQRAPALGVDALRWWVASHSTQHSQIIISKRLLADCQNEIIRLRNIIKYLLGVVNDLEKSDFERNVNLNYFDQYMVTESHNFLKQINDHYNNFKYNHVAQTILHFVSNKVSGLYCHCVKDRLYCSPKDSNERLSAQLVIHTIMVLLSKAIGPILPHLVEEAWQHHPLFEKPFYFTQEFPVLPQIQVDSTLMDAILEIKRDVAVIAKNESLKKYEMHLKVNSDLFNKLQVVNKPNGLNDSVLCDILELSAITLEEVRNSEKCWQIEMSQTKNCQCLRCRKFNVVDNSEKCLRCEKVLSSL